MFSRLQTFTRFHGWVPRCQKIKPKKTQWIFRNVIKYIYFHRLPGHVYNLFMLFSFTSTWNIDPLETPMVIGSRFTQDFWSKPAFLCLEILAAVSPCDSSLGVGVGHVKKKWICLSWDFIEWFTLPLKNKADASYPLNIEMCSSLGLKFIEAIIQFQRSGAIIHTFQSVAQLWPRQPHHTHQW